MSGQMKMSAMRSRRSGPPGAEPSRMIWLTGVVFGLLIGMTFVMAPADADEFDPLVAYQAAKPLNDRWQACAASFAKRRLRTKQPSTRIAAAAFAHCGPLEEQLRRFLADKVGPRSARASVGLLHERYLSDLTAAIDTLRARK